VAQTFPDQRHQDAQQKSHSADTQYRQCDPHHVLDLSIAGYKLNLTTPRVRVESRIRKEFVKAPCNTLQKTLMRASANRVRQPGG
jgi:hypothetical protein